MSNKKRKIPINRVNRFFDDSEFNLEIDMGREYLEGDLNFSVVLYSVDREATNNDDLYNEVSADQIRYLPPVELKVILELAASEPKTYNPNGTFRIEEYGKLTFHVYVDQLKEKGVDIIYGDFIAYADREDNIKYFTVTNDGKIYSDNGKTILGYKGFYRTIECVPADPNEFEGK